MSVKSCQAQNDHDMEFCECESCFRANGGTFVYGNTDLDVIEHHNGEENNENVKPQKEKWSEQDIREMISIWGSKEVLANPKHPSYYNTRERSRAVEEIRNELAERGINFSTKQVNDKMVNLRTYYGSQKRQIEASKRNAFSTDDVFVSRWKFFDSLKFLSDTIISRSSIDVATKSIDSGSDNGSNFSPTGMVLTRPYTKRRRFSAGTHNYKGDELSFKNEENSIDATPMIKSENSMVSVVETFKTGLQAKPQDEIFGELITAMLSEIPECHEKAMLKLEIQHKIVTTQYKTLPVKKIAKF